MGDAVGEPRVASTGRGRRTRSPSACTASRRPTTRRATPPGTSSAAPTATPYVARWWMGTGSLVDFTSPGGRARGGASRPGACSRWACEGIKADDGEGYYFPPDVALRRRPHAAPRRRGRYGGAVPALDAARARRGARRATACSSGAAAGRGQQATGHAVGRRPGLGLLVAARRWWRRRSPRRRAASRTGRTTSAATSASAWWSAARRSCCCAGSQFGCFTPLMQAHGRFEQEAWTYDRETLELYRELRAAARAARALHPRRGGDAAPLRACRSSARCASIDPGDRARLGGGRRLRLRPGAVGGAGARGGRARARGRRCPRGALDRLLDGGARRGRRRGRRRRAPLGRIPVCVRERGAGRDLPGRARRRGASATRPRRERPLEATLWGEPPLRPRGGRGWPTAQGSAGNVRCAGRERLLSER